MIRHYSNHRYQSTVQEPAEALQTDVMRFMAIICMCLMVVFSLVQSIPMQNENNQPNLDLVKIKLPEQKSEPVLAPVPEPVPAPKPIIKTLKKEKSKPEYVEPAPKEIIKKIPASPQPEAEQKIGFSLRFASDAALENLLNDQNRVKLYLFASNRSWKLNIKSGRRLKFLLSDPPGQVYDMEMQTVPGNIQRAASKVVAAFGRDQVSYGVHLSKDMQDQINRFMSELQGGDLVILQNGTIKVTP